MSLAQTLQNSIQAKTEKVHKQNIQQTTEDKIKKLIRETQLKVWKLLIEQKINNSETDIQLSLRSKNNTHRYLTDYEYQNNLRSLLHTPEGEKFVKWLESNGLKYSIVNKDDGVGYESWDSLIIEVA